MKQENQEPHWKDRHYAFFQNRECEYFPCHRIADPDRFNCLFCYCPLYALGRDCGGNFRYTDKGIKDCTACLIPHLRENYGRIIDQYPRITDRMRQMEQTLVQIDKNDKRVESRKDKKEKKDEKDNKSSAGSEKAGRRIVMMACTARGFEVMGRAARALARAIPDAEILQTGRCAYVPGFEDGPKLSELTESWFGEADALVYFAAAGIAVRCIAPFVRDKFTDPAVLAVDENGRFVISLLSGHAGGANRLCGILADALGAAPVVTTATDGRGLFAVDVFAVERGLQISDRRLAKQISARLLAGETVAVYDDFYRTDPVDTVDSDDTLDPDDPAGPADLAGTARPAEHGGPAEPASAQDRSGRIERTQEPAPAEYGAGVRLTENRGEADIIISHRRDEADRPDALYLIPRTVTLGVGCRKGIAPEAVMETVTEVLRDTGIFPEALCGIASIDLKKDEPALHILAETWQLPLTFYTADQLNRLPGTFTESGFVRSVTGVDCVCERSAVCLAGAGAKLILKKQSRAGVTAALAIKYH